MRHVGFAVEDEFIEFGTDVFQSCFLIHLFEETVAKDVALILKVVVTVHDFAALFHVLVILSGPLTVIFVRRELQPA
jgi:hypothetical protein